MVQVRDSDLCNEKKNVREGINESKIKKFNFLIHSLGNGNILNMYFDLLIGIIL